MDILALIVGVLLGIVIGWLLAKRTSGDSKQSTEDLENHYVRKERFDDLQKRLEDEIAEHKSAEDQNIQLNAAVATWQERYKSLEQRLSEQREELNTLQEKFKNDFKVLAQEILEKNSQTFKEQNKEQIGTILSPFKEKLESFEKKVEETYDKEQKERISLKTEVKHLMEMNEKLSQEAKNLTTALKGDVKTQGNWGEVVLERILEKSGLERNREYFIQQSITGEDGKRYQPDVIIKLPDDKNVIIDAKVSLIAYERFAASETIEEQQQHLKQHLASLKAHVKGLSDKNYQSLYGIDGLDFVLLFVPIEGAFTAAVQADGNLFQEAFERNVVLVSTSTLLATLRTIASIWKQEKQTQNALEIARQAGNLYEKFVGFTDDLLALGKQMNTAKGTYESAMNKLVDGRGNLITRVENLRKLGVNTTKDLDQKLIDRATMHEDDED
jgi:DNA recombination protein RmuC